MKDCADLLQLAARANRLATKLRRENETHRLLGRLVRDPFDFEALAEVAVNQAMEDRDLPKYFSSGNGLVQLQLAIAQVSRRYWKEIWDDAHPEQSEHALRNDVELPEVWRDKICGLIEKCHQQWVLKVNADEYKGALLAAGADDEAVNWLLNWFALLQSE